MVKAKGLGKGLESLLSSSGETTDINQLTTINVNDVVPGRYQPRVQMDDAALQELAESIRAQGVIQPVIVRELGLSGYELIAGERRWRASQLAGLTEIPAVIKSISDETALAMGLIENIQRENLNPIEEANGLKRLIEEFGLTHETVAKAVGRSRSSISNSLRLLNLPQPIQDLVHTQKLEMGHARAILSVPNVMQQIEIAKKAAKNNWSVREVEKKCRQLSAKPAKTNDSLPKNPESKAIEEALERYLSTSVKIVSKNQHSGQLVVYFDDPESLNYILQRMGIQEKY